MDDFTFYNPTRIEFGRDKEKLIGQYVAADGVRKVILCYGSDRIKRSGLFDTVAGSLRERGIEVTGFGGIVSNPVISTVRRAIELARINGIEAIVSVGGGSVLDSAKAIAAGALYDGDVWDLFVGRGVIERALPVYDVITMAASGSEMNPTGVVTNRGNTAETFHRGGTAFPAGVSHQSGIDEKRHERLSCLFGIGHHRAFDRGIFHGERPAAFSVENRRIRHQYRDRDDRNPAGKSRKRQCAR